jgi:hypothetical protein
MLAILPTSSQGKTECLVGEEDGLGAPDKKLERKM